MTDTAEADAVADAYKAFARVHTDAINVLTGKAGLVGQIFGRTIAAIVRVDENVIDVSAVAFMGYQIVTDHLCPMTANKL